jgi:hypothetical protein
LEFFVGRFQLLVRGLELFDRGLERLASENQFLFKILGPFVLFLRCPFFLLRLGLWRGRFLEDDHHEPLHLLRVGQGSDGQVDVVVFTVCFDPKPAIDPLSHLGHGVVDSQTDLMPDSFPGHVQDIEVGAAGRRLQVFSGLAVDVQEIPTAVDNDRWRCEDLEQCALRNGTHIDRLRLSLFHLSHNGRVGPGQGAPSFVLHGKGAFWR